MRSELFSDKPFYKRLIRLTLPIALQSFMLAAVAAADALMLGVLDSSCMSAVSLASQIQFVQNNILFATTGSVIILGAQYWGKRDIDTVGDVLSISMRVSAFVSIVFFMLCRLCPGALMDIFTDIPELRALGIKYLKVAAWSYLLTGISQNYLAVMKVSEHATASAYISSGAVIMNIALNALFIFGFKLDVEGAAYATVVSRVAELIAVLILSFRKGFIKLNLKRLFVWKKQLSLDFARCTIPVLSACMLWGIGFTSYNAFMGHLGDAAVNANSVASVVRDLVCCVCNGIGSASGIIIGGELGAGKLSTAKTYGDRIVKLAYICGFLSTVVMLILTPVLMAFIKLDTQSRGLLWGMMLIMSFYMIGRCVNTILINGVMYSGGDVLFDSYSLAVTMWGLAVPLAVLGTFVFDWHPLIVYACTCLDEVGKIPWVMVHYKKYKWVKDLTRDMN